MRSNTNKIKGAFWIVIFWMSIFFSPSLVNAYSSPKGVVSSADYSYIKGYVCDPDDYSRAVQVHFYADYAPAKSGVYLGNVMADEVGDASVGTACGGNVAHAFSYPTPEGLKGDMPHIVFAYGIDVEQGAHTLLEGAPMIVAAPLPGIPTVGITGAEETVYDWTTMKCEETDIPDIGVRAFRDVDGKVHLISSSPNSYENTGNSLDLVTHSCNKVMSSTEKTPFYDFAYHEWMASPYTLDGTNIYTLIHNEWYSKILGEPCYGDINNQCWVNSVTLSESNDKGKTYHHPDEYKISTPAMRWKDSDGNQVTRYGAFVPSNIVHYDDYYYAIYWSGDTTGTTRGLHGLETGPCLMRTKTIASAATWEKLTKMGWDTSTTAVCSPLVGTTLPLAFQISSLTYNKYLDAFVAVMYQKTNATTDGIYMAYSKNLLTWTDRIKSFNIRDNKDNYPSLLDPTDTSMNFEVTGQNPYLYYMNYINPTTNTYDRDLVRKKITFTKAAENGVCGAAQGTYLATDTYWRDPVCTTGLPSPLLPWPFLVPGATMNWQCVGQNGGTTASCIATRASNAVIPNAPSGLGVL
jgi:hypothetical protein